MFPLRTPTGNWGKERRREEPQREMLIALTRKNIGRERETEWRDKMHGKECVRLKRREREVSSWGCRVSFLIPFSSFVPSSLRPSVHLILLFPCIFRQRERERTQRGHTHLPWTVSCPSSFFLCSESWCLFEMAAAEKLSWLAFGCTCLLECRVSNKIWLLTARARRQWIAYLFYLFVDRTIVEKILRCKKLTK